MSQKRVLLYAGTTEGRQLARALELARIPALVCVATAYGEQMLEDTGYIEVRVGRQTAEEMRLLLDGETFAAVVDATHPYARVVTEQIRECLAGRGIPLLRLLRSTAVSEDAYPDIQYFADVRACVRALRETEGNILLTTGSKDLKAFAEDPGLRERLYVRVLPSAESLALCEEAGVCGKHIIAMQGPFSRELNLALLGQYGIRCLVTKESGVNGGLEEKLQAAGEAGALCCVIGSPVGEAGYSLREVAERLGSLLHVSIPLPGRRITLAGIGMGHPDMLTGEVRRAIFESKYVFGAARVLAQLPCRRECIPLYRAEDIIPRLHQMDEEDGGEGDVTVLFSGDTGFYSGADRLYEALCGQKRWSVTLLPGVSAVSAFSARCGVPWQDARLLSLHGKRPGEWESALADAVRHESKTFCLLSGREQLDAACRLLCARELGEVRMHVGYALSYPQEEIRETTPAGWGECAPPGEGLYIALFRNEAAQSRRLNSGHGDGEFLRGEAPMTKEEVRSVALSKLHLHERAVLYDIGSGTGSVAVEAALLSPGVRVYALECKEEACALIRENARRFHCDNVTVIPGMAPASMEGIGGQSADGDGTRRADDLPTHAFIGGSRGRLGEILEALYRRNPAMRVVITAISLETLAELAEIPRRYPVQEWEWVQLQVSRSRTVGEHRLLQGENPVVLCAFTFRPRQT